VAGDPADIGGAPEDVAVVVVEDVLMGHRGIDEVAAGGVHDALGLAGGAGGVEDEERVFGVHLLDRGNRSLGLGSAISL
jgi:acyl-CoA synthetase (AMP-forming)/AMP-acid ligase II